MDPLLAELLVSNEVGKSAEFYRYPRSKEARTPINFFLDHVQSEIQTPLDVYWVNGGIPELCLIGSVQDAIVVYNTRYIELVYLMRRLLGDSAMDDLRQMVAERTCLKVMAELSVRYGNPAFAIQLWLQSTIESDITLVDIPGTALMDLEMQPMSEAYAATWFFGLAHEAGHVFARERNGSPLEYFPPREIEAALETAITGEDYEIEIREQIKKLGDGEHILSNINIASEAYADLFAAIQLFNGTCLILKEVGKEIDLEQFLSECVLFWSILWVLERCKSIASNAQRTLSDRQKAVMILQPYSYSIRSLLVMPRLNRFLAQAILHTDSPTEEHLQTVEDLSTGITGFWQVRIGQLDKGLSKAMRYAFAPAENREDLWRKFAVSIAEDTSGGLSFETRGFCDLIESFHGRNESAEALRRIASRKGS